MAAKKTAKKTDADQELGALRTRVASILHSNGFDGTKAAEQITAAVSEFVGGDVSSEKEGPEKTAE